MPTTYKPADDPRGKLLTPGQVAEIFAVDPKTVNRWANAGKIPAVRTLGGHRRYYEQDVREALTRGQDW